jgi:hypothetical protein
MNLQKDIIIRSKKIRESAKGEDCQIRVEGCNNNSETVVFCHLGGAGIGAKSSDLFGAYGCSTCHGKADGQIPSHWSATVLGLYFYQAVIRTQQILVNKGLIKRG